MEYPRSVFLLICYILACFSSRVNGLSFSLDVASDQRGRMWKIQGSTEYIEDGTILRDRFLQYFPDRFEFASLDLAKGIWVILPHDCSPWMDDSEELNSAESSWLGKGIGSLFSDKTNETDDATKPVASTQPPKKKSKSTTTTEKPLCYSSSNATFKATLKAQLFASTTIRYCFGGNAVIRVGGVRDAAKPFEMKANGQTMNNWIEETVPLNGSSMVLDALVEGKGDYILIDRITVDTMEPTPRGKSTTTTATTTKEPSFTSTKSPQPAPASGQGKVGVALSSFIPIFVVIVLSSSIFN